MVDKIIIEGLICDAKRAFENESDIALVFDIIGKAVALSYENVNEDGSSLEDRTLFYQANIDKAAYIMTVDMGAATDMF